MSKYNVKKIDAAGKVYEEVVDAENQAAINAIVRDQGMTLVSAMEEGLVGSKKKFTFNIEINWFNRVKLHDKIVFVRNLGAMLEAGLALSRALTVIEKQTKQKKFKGVVNDLNKSISQGKTLHDSMQLHSDIFTPLMISMVKAGEESGSLAQSLRVVGTQMENSYNLTKKIRGAMMYPMVIVVAMVVIGFFMMTYVVPVLSATFKELNAELPLSTRIIIGTSDFLKANIILSIIAMILAAAGIYFALRTPSGKRFRDYALLHTPVIAPLIKEINSARTARTLSSLLTSGVDVLVAVRITADVLQNSYYKEVMTVIEEKVQKGEPIADVFNSMEHLYPSFVGEMISVGEETGQLAPMLLGVAVFYEGEVDQKTKDMSSVIEPFLMVFIGLVVGVFAVSMIGPIYSLGNNI